MAKKAQILSGASASSMTALFIQPFDVVKTAFLTGDNANKLGDSVKFVYHRYGPSGYWRGIKPAISRAIFTGGAGFPILELLKSISPEGFSWNVICSAITRASVITMVSPLTVLKVRMEAPQSTSYRNIRYGFFKIYKDVGLKGYYVGLGPNLMRDIPFSGLAYGFYQYYYDSFYYLSGGIGKTGYINFLAAACGSCTASIITQPFDVLKTRMQFAHIDKHHYYNYSGIADGIVRIWMKEGVRGFTRGLSIRITEKTLSYAIVWGIYEKLKEKLAILRENSSV